MKWTRYTASVSDTRPHDSCALITLEIYIYRYIQIYVPLALLIKKKIRCTVSTKCKSMNLPRTRTSFGSKTIFQWFPDCNGCHKLPIRNRWARVLTTKYISSILIYLFEGDYREIFCLSFIREPRNLPLLFLSYFY